MTIYPSALKCSIVCFRLLAVSIIFFCSTPSHSLKILRLGQEDSTSIYQDRPSRFKVRLEKIFKTDGSPGKVAWSPDGKLLAATSSFDRRIVIWDYAKEIIVQTITKTIFGSGPIIFINNGEQFLTSAVHASDRNNLISLSIVDVQSGKVIRDINGPFQNPQGIMMNVARSFAISSDAGYAATITKDGFIDYLNFYRTDSWALVASLRLDPDDRDRLGASDLQFSSATGNLIVPGYKEVEVWNPVDQTILEKNSIYSLSYRKAFAISPNGRLAATSGGLGQVDRIEDPDSLRLWQIAPWSKLASAKSVPDRSADVKAIAFNPTQPYLATLSYDGKIRFWRSTDLKLIQEIDVGGKGGVSIAFSPDGSRLAITRDWDVRVIKIEN